LLTFSGIPHALGWNGIFYQSSFGSGVCIAYIDDEFGNAFSPLGFYFNIITVTSLVGLVVAQLMLLVVFGLGKIKDRSHFVDGKSLFLHAWRLLRQA